MNQETAAPHRQLDSPIRNFSVLLSPTPRGARLARLLAVEQLRSWGCPLEAPSQVIAELAANAVTHGRVSGRDFRLTLYVVGVTLRIEVTETRGDRLPHLGRAEPEAESGRGLVLVAALADRWGVALGPPPRKTVWADMDVSGIHHPHG
ncbi:ATP-binding protein [Streptomyces mirabilis]|uniref:ATP-binding protein n=1 Tax=Streptomyces mirabilis TaxID=68239 RepID=UPI00332ECFE7